MSSTKSPPHEKRGIIARGSCGHNEDRRISGVSMFYFFSITCKGQCVWSEFYMRIFTICCFYLERSKMEGHTISALIGVGTGEIFLT